MEKKQLTLPYFLNKKDEERDEELLKLQERLGFMSGFCSPRPVQPKGWRAEGKGKWGRMRMRGNGA